MSKQTHWKRKKGSGSGEDYFNTSKVRKERGPVGSSDIEVEQIESNNTNVSDILNKANRVLFNELVPVFPVFSPPSIQKSESSHYAAMATSIDADESAIIAIFEKEVKNMWSCLDRFTKKTDENI